MNIAFGVQTQIYQQRIGTRHRMMKSIIQTAIGKQRPNSIVWPVQLGHKRVYRKHYFVDMSDGLIYMSLRKFGRKTVEMMRNTFHVGEYGRNRIGHQERQLV